MKEPLYLASAIHSIPTQTTRPWQRRRVVFLFLLAWTVLTALALWWLLRANPRHSVWIIQAEESLQPNVTERFQAWFKTEAGLQRLYPWLLLGPYVALLAFYFPLERGRLRLSLVLNIAACAGFVAVCQTINARTGIATGNVVIMKTQPPRDWSGSELQKGTNSVKFPQAGMGGMLREEVAKNPVANPFDGDMPIGARTQPELSDAGLTNLVLKWRQGFKPPLPPPGPAKLSLWPMLVDLLAYGAIVGLAHSVHFYRRFREREHRALFLESNLAKARLDALRAQLQPHFLFNSLNAIVTLLRRDPRLAEATLMSLSELLRLALSQSEKSEVTLGEELQFVGRYLEIQQTRFGDKLRVEQNIEPEALDCLVPALLLQPLVENAIRHGIEPAESGGVVRLTASRQDGKLVVTVEDDGVGLGSAPIDVRELKTAAPQAVTSASRIVANSTPSAPVPKAGTGIGLANLRARLESLYGSCQRLELVPRPEAGVSVVIEIPWRPARSLEEADVFKQS